VHSAVPAGTLPFFFHFPSAKALGYFQTGRRIVSRTSTCAQEFHRTLLFMLQEIDDLIIPVRFLMWIEGALL
jgi:hypothetical protein